MISSRCTFSGVRMYAASLCTEMKKAYQRPPFSSCKRNRAMEKPLYPCSGEQRLKSVAGSLTATGTQVQAVVSFAATKLSFSHSGHIRCPDEQYEAENQALHLRSALQVRERHREARRRALGVLADALQVSGHAYRRRALAMEQGWTRRAPLGPASPALHPMLQHREQGSAPACLSKHGASNLKPAYTPRQ